MVNKSYCDCCSQELSTLDRPYFISYGEPSQIPLMKSKFQKNGVICKSCLDKINKFVMELKDGKKSK